MAISAATIWEGRSASGSDNNGGGFVAGSGGTDRSQQNGAQVAVGGGSVTSSVTTTTITFTGGTYTVLAGDVGNIVQVISGTNTTPGFFQIVSVGAGLNGTWVMDRNVVSAGTQTDLVANMGGALGAGSLAKLAAAMIGSNKAYLTGTGFTGTATNTFAQSVTPGSGVTRTRIIGYGATRGDGTHAKLTLATNTGLTGIAVTGAGFNVEQIDVDCGSLGTSTGISFSAGGQYSFCRACTVSNFTAKGILISGGFHVCEACEVTGGTAAATIAIHANSGSSVLVTRCSVHDNACLGVQLLAGAMATYNLVTNNSGATSDGIQVQYGTTVMSNTVHGNGRDGLRNSTPNDLGIQWRNNIFSNNGGFGLNGATSALPAQPEYDGNAYFGNTSGARNNIDSTAGIAGVNPYVNTRDVTLSGSPYVGPTTGSTANFGLNSTAGAGAACRASGSPSAWPGNTGTTGFLDMGAVQHQDSGSGGLIGGGELAGGLQ